MGVAPKQNALLGTNVKLSILVGPPPILPEFKPAWYPIMVRQFHEHDLDIANFDQTTRSVFR